MLNTDRTASRHRTKTRNTAVALALACALMACSSKQDNLVPAPRGDLATLEKLATAFRSVSETLPQSPVQQIPPDKLKFVRMVFSEAGFDYHATLLAFAADELEPTNQRQRDMAELVLFPTIGVSDVDLAKLYTEAELAAVGRIKETF